MSENEGALGKGKGKQWFAFKMMMSKVSIFIAQSVWCHISSVEATLPPRGCKIGSVLREWKKKIGSVLREWKKIQHVMCILRYIILDTQYSVLLKFGERGDSEKKIFLSWKAL